MAGEWEEESLVFVELGGMPSSQLSPDTGQLHAEILGLASDHPVMQICGQIFVGHYEEAEGTYLFLEKKETGESLTKESETKKVSANNVSFDYFCKSNKKLVMQPACLVEKTTTASLMEKDAELTTAKMSENAIKSGECSDQNEVHAL